MFIDDVILEKSDQSVCLHVWHPDHTLVVVGAANEENREVYTSQCHDQGIPVLKRAGGGGAVVLYPGCAVISLGLWVKRQFNNSSYFTMINAAVIEALTTMEPGLAGLGQRGFSDITYDDRKIVGTSLFRSKHYLLYQASILVDLDLELLNRCLPHPSREPDYRHGKAHSDFLSSLANIVPSLTVEGVCDGLRLHLEAILRRTMAEELIPADLEHLPHLLRRARSGIETSSK